MLRIFSVMLTLGHEMITKLTGQRGVSSIDGFTVVRTGSPMTQFVLTYTESDGHSIDYPLENLIPGSIDVISVSGIHCWSPPFEAEPVPHKKRIQIAKRIVDGMNTLGEKLELSEQ